MNHLLTMTLGIALGATIATATINKKIDSSIEQSRRDAVYYATRPSSEVAPLQAKPSPRTFKF